PRSRRLTVVALAAILALPGLLARAPAARAAEACFPQTGQCVQEPFLSYWLAHGGLAINGFPLSTASPEKLEDGKVYTVQYFERARLEWPPENPAPYDVLLGQFGRRILAARSPVAPSPFPVMAPLAANYSGNPGMRARLALPTAPGGQVAGAVQHFQQGWML